MQLQHIELDQLSISKMNMRYGRRRPDISAILPSVKKRGVLLALLVRPNGKVGKYEIVAGSRRYYAALEAAKEQDNPQPLPCAVMEEGDDAAALEASLMENFVREDPDEVTKWETFKKLIAKGRTVEDIAATFDLAESVVKRILALGNLLPQIRTAYRAEEIDAATVRHLTLATKDQQKAWLALYKDEEAYAPLGHALKSWLFGGETIPTSIALFDVADYEGAIVKDLFEDTGYFADADQFWEAQSAAVEAKKSEFLEEGWSDVQIIGPNERFDRWEHKEASKRNGGRIYIDMNSQGAVTIHEGYVTTKEARARSAGKPDSVAEKPVRPEITGPISEYIDLHRHAAVRSKLAANPYVALRVMVVHAICGSPLWKVEVQQQRSRKDATVDSVRGGVAETRFEERRAAILAVLDFDADEPSVTQGREPCNGKSGLLLRLLDLPDKVVLEILGVVMAETLAAGTGLIETLGVHLDVEMADYWSADDTFLELVRDREVLTALLAEIGGARIAAAHASEKTKTVKGVIADHLTGENGREKQEGWVPRWMAFPPTAYTERGGVGTVTAASRVKWQIAETASQMDDQGKPAAEGTDESGEAANSEAAEDEREAA